MVGNLWMDNSLRVARTKAKILLIFILVSGIVGSLIGAYAWVHKTITIYIDGTPKTVETYKQSVQEVLAENEISVGPKDELKPIMTAKLKEGDSILITRAVTTNIVADGDIKQIVDLPTTVEKLLKAQGVKIAEKDKVFPALDTLTRNGMEVKVVRVSEELVEDTYSIPFSIERKDDSKLERGFSKVLQKGKNGQGKKLTRIVYENGVEVKREVIGEVILQKPVNHILSNGSLAVASRGGRSFKFKKALYVTTTAYAPDPRCTLPIYDPTRTAIGMKVEKGIVAVDPRVIPLRSKLYIEGYGFAIAADTGSAIKGNRIDVVYSTYDQAMDYGRRRNIKVYVLED